MKVDVKVGVKVEEVNGMSRRQRLEMMRRTQQEQE